MIDSRWRHYGKYSLLHTSDDGIFLANLLEGRNMLISLEDMNYIVDGLPNNPLNRSIEQRCEDVEFITQFNLDHKEI